MQNIKKSYSINQLKMQEDSQNQIQNTLQKFQKNFYNIPQRPQINQISKMNESIRQSFLQQQFAFTVGNITGQGVTLVDKDYNIIQLPKSLLPIGTASGSVIRMTLRRDIQAERKEEQQINALIQKIQTGSQTNNTLIGVDGDIESNNSARETLKEKPQKKVLSSKPSQAKVVEQVKVQQKPSTGMKKKPKMQPVQQQKPKSVRQLDQKPLSVQKGSLREKSASRRTSSAMKKIKAQSQQEGKS